MSILAGKYAIITGGAGALGQAVTAAFLREGASVFVPVQQAAELDRLRASVPSAASLSGDVLDLTDSAGVTSRYAALAAAAGGLDILVNIAGGFAGGTPVHLTEWDVWQQQLDLNLKTCVLSCRAAIPHMLGREAAIITIGSRTATQSGANLAAYATAKRGVIQLTEALAAELRDQGVTANAVLPSVIDTPANRAANPQGDYSRWVQPARIAEVILFLAGPHARIISGASIPVYGRA